MTNDIGWVCERKKSTLLKPVGYVVDVLKGIFGIASWFLPKFVLYRLKRMAKKVSG